jgi:Integral membrane protein S linking to the trans Golgi network
MQRRVSATIDIISPPSLTRENSIYYIYQLIRKPRLILDFALTLVLNHLVLTTYYSASLP